MAKAKVTWNLGDLLNTVNAENVNEVDQHGFAPIHYAAGSGGLELIKALRALGANLDLYTTGDSVDNKPLTPLVVAMKNGKVAAANLLLEQGASPDLMVDGLSPWTYAIRHKTLAPEFTSVLILNNANISQLQGIIQKYGSAILTKLEVQPELVEKVAFSVGGGAKGLFDDYFSTQIEEVVVGGSSNFSEENDCVEVSGELSKDYTDDLY
ncbi:MAG: ankyrin repeat domain-containing protein [Rickettsiales bacterium]|nr:ankyrin repeat domain-containing protein [Rickettsiales bacterium]MCA0254300.1 ankyrin repeat domain-containing protein [Pseudomonadota bacterium]